MGTDELSSRVRAILFYAALLFRFFFNGSNKRVYMTNEDKQTRIRPWIDQEARITVHFIDAPALNTIVTNCTDQLVDLSIETQVPSMRQNISVPLSSMVRSPIVDSLVCAMEACHLVPFLFWRTGSTHAVGEWHGHLDEGRSDEGRHE